MGLSERLGKLASANDGAQLEGAGAYAGAVSQPHAAASPWLYGAGLCVTFSGLYAANYGREDTGFVVASYGIAAAGYAASYLARRFQVRYEAFRLPFLVLVALALFLWLNSTASEGADGLSVLTDRSHAMLTLCLWLALLQPFTAQSDMAVLFSCVPCMSLIAIVSSSNPTSETQYAFLVFVAAATFLMVHENYLRTRAAAVAAGIGRMGPNLFGGQVRLALGCVACAFLLANIVAVPMNTFGRSLSLATGWAQSNQVMNRAAAAMATAVLGDELRLALAVGPVTESDRAVMSVEPPTDVNLRGNTFDYYTGAAFENRLRLPHARLTASDERTVMQSSMKFHPAGNQGTQEAARFRIPPSPAEAPMRSARGRRTIEQTITVLSPGMMECYAAGSPVSVSMARDVPVLTTQTGSLFVGSPFSLNGHYRMESLAPTDDTSAIRAASAKAAHLPAAIARTYLQRETSPGHENAQLRQVAERVTEGISNGYDRAAALQTYIAQTCKYNIQTPPAPSTSDRVEYFLTVSHEGYCDSFAAAMTMLCRYADLPARVVTGFLPGKSDDSGTTVVRDRDKHAWTEVYFSGIGWVPFDATAGSQDVSDRSAHRTVARADFLTWLKSHGILPPLLLAALIGLIAYVAWTEIMPRLRARGVRSENDGRPATNRAVTQAYLEGCRLLARRGLPRGRSETPSEYLGVARQVLASAAPSAAAPLAALTALHDRYRYGRDTAAAADVEAAIQHQAALRSALARVSAKALTAASHGQKNAAA